MWFSQTSCWAKESRPQVRCLLWLRVYKVEKEAKLISTACGGGWLSGRGPWGSGLSVGLRLYQEGVRGITRQAVRYHVRAWKLCYTWWKEAGFRDALTHPGDRAVCDSVCAVPTKPGEEKQRCQGAESEVATLPGVTRGRRTPLRSCSGLRLHPLLPSAVFLLKFHVASWYSHACLELSA